jgi:hypothetical protein
MLQVFHPDVAYVTILHMLQASMQNVSSVSYVCCKCVYLDVVVAIHICCKHMFVKVSSVSNICCKYVYLDVVVAIHICCKHMFVKVSLISDVCCRSAFMLQH